MTLILWSVPDVFHLKTCRACPFEKNAPHATLQCANCKSERYCSKECQIKRWPEHKKGCKELTERRKQAYSVPISANMITPFLEDTYDRELIIMALNKRSISGEEYNLVILAWSKVSAYHQEVTRQSSLPGEKQWIIDENGNTKEVIRFTPGYDPKTTFELGNIQCCVHTQKEFQHNTIIGNDKVKDCVEELAALNIPDLFILVGLRHDETATVHAGTLAMPRNKEFHKSGFTKMKTK